MFSSTMLSLIRNSSRILVSIISPLIIAGNSVSAISIKTSLYWSISFEMRFLIIRSADIPSLVLSHTRPKHSFSVIPNASLLKWSLTIIRISGIVYSIMFFVFFFYFRSSYYLKGSSMFCSGIYSSSSSASDSNPKLFLLSESCKNCSSLLFSCFRI